MSSYDVARNIGQALPDLRIPRPLYSSAWRGSLEAAPRRAEGAHNIRRSTTRPSTQETRSGTCVEVRRFEPGRNGARARAPNARATAADGARCGIATYQIRIRPTAPPLPSNALTIFVSSDEYHVSEFEAAAIVVKDVRYDGRCRVRCWALKTDV